MSFSHEEMENTLASYVCLRKSDIAYSDATQQTLYTISQFFQADDYFKVDPSLYGLLDEFHGIALDQKALFKWVTRLQEETRKFLFEKNKRLQIALSQDYWERLNYRIALTQKTHNQRIRKQDIENAFIRSYIAALTEKLYEQLSDQIEYLEQTAKNTLLNLNIPFALSTATLFYQSFIPQIQKARIVVDSINDMSRKLKTRWDKAIDIFVIFSEASNIGIVFSIISKWWPLFGEAGFLTVGFITDPVIYGFKSLIRLTRLIGRTCFNITFEDEEYGTHQWQTQADIITLGFFGVAIPMFLGVIITSPLSLPIAWTLALGGLAIVGYFDYAYPAKLAYEHYKEKNQAFLQAVFKYEEATSPHLKELARQELIRCKQEKDVAYEEYKTKRNAKWLFLALYIGLVSLLICGSIATAGVPAGVAFGMYVVSKIASVYLIGIALGRFTNYLHSLEWPRLKKFVDWIWPKQQPELEEEAAPDTSLKKSLSTAHISRALTHKIVVDQTEGVTLEAAEAIERKYYAYKKTKLISPSSDASKKTLMELHDPYLQTNQQRLETITRYLSNEKNQDKALYHIISKELSHSLFKRASSHARPPISLNDLKIRDAQKRSSVALKVN